MKLTKSFAFKNSFLYLLVFFLIFGVFGYLMFKNSAEKIVETANLELQHKNDLVDIQTSDYIEELISSLDYLTYNPVLKNFLREESEATYELLANNYLSLLEAKKDFDQIRFINAESGKEIVRVERKNRQSYIVNDSLLQVKKDRPYFTKSIKLKESDIFFSPIDLNKEFGKISLPKTPTLRLARPIVHNGIKKGVVVININLQNLFSNLKTTVGSNFGLELLNENGYYLMHDEVDSTFLFEYGYGRSSKYASLLAENNSTIENTRALKHLRKIEVPNMTYELTSVVTSEKQVLLSSYDEWRNRSIWLMLITSLLLFGFTYLIMSRQSKTLQKITDALKAFPTNRKAQSELENRTDEIGEMAKSFSQMANLVNSQIDSLNVEKVKAQNAVKEKTEFIENISHEIRNPLQSILGLNTMLIDNQPNGNQLDMLESMKFNTTNLLGLVNNVLDYQNVLRGEIKLNLSWQHLSKLINEVVMGNKYAAEEKGLSIQATVHNQLRNLEHRIDHLRLSQILGNLISNAIKFTPTGGSINILCQLQKDENPQSIKFTVQDSGRGMTQSELENVRDRYFSGKGIQSLESSHGIGLTIVSELLHLYDSELHISSVVGEGAEFTFVLDLERRELVVVENGAAIPMLTDDMSILIVEDDQQIINLYSHIFANSGANVKTIEDVRLLASLEGKYDIIVADYRFNKMTLIDVEEDLIKLKKENASLIIASATQQDVNAFRNEFVHVQSIRKPFANNDFKKVLNQAYLSSSFGLPNFEKIKQDYDYNEDKYRRAFELLVSEWKSMTDRLTQAIDNDDSVSFEAGLHKFITTLRRIDLHMLNDWLEDIKSNMPLGLERKIATKIQVKYVLDNYLTKIEQA